MFQEMSWNTRPALHTASPQLWVFWVKGMGLSTKSGDEMTEKKLKLDHSLQAQNLGWHSQISVYNKKEVSLLWIYLS